MKLDFFARIYLAITDFRLYPFVVQREKFINALAYFLCFILLFSAILSAGVTSRAMNWLNNFTCIYNEKVDDFEVKNGELIVAQNMDFEYEKVRIYANGDLNFGELNENVFKDSENIVTVLALKDSISVGNENVGFVITKDKDVNLDINKAETYESLRFALDSWIFKLSLAIIIFCGVFVAYLITKFLNVVGITLMLLFLGYVFGTKYKFKDYMKAAFYVITLPVITELIALIITGTVSDYAYITYYLLVYVYMYYAIRALKLDNIIMATQEKIFAMRGNPVEKPENQEKQVSENKEENKSENAGNELNKDEPKEDKHDEK